MDGIFSALEGLVKWFYFSVFVLLPLGAWKAVEIVIWCFRHFQITFN